MYSKYNDQNRHTIKKRTTERIWDCVSASSGVHMQATVPAASPGCICSLCHCEARTHRTCVVVSDFFFSIKYSHVSFLQMHTILKEHKF